MSTDALNIFRNSGGKISNPTPVYLDLKKMQSGGQMSSIYDNPSLSSFLPSKASQNNVNIPNSTTQVTGQETDLIDIYFADPNVSTYKKSEMMRALQDGVKPAQIIADLEARGYKGPEKEKLGLGQIAKENLGAMASAPKGAYDIGKNILGGAVNNAKGVVNMGASSLAGMVGKDVGDTPIFDQPENLSFIQRSINNLTDASGNLANILSPDVVDSQSRPETIFQSFMATARPILDILGDGFISTLGTITPDEQKEFLIGELQNAMQTKGGQWVQGKFQEYEQNMETLKEMNPRAYRNFEAIFTGLELALEGVGLKAGNDLIAKGGKVIDDVANSKAGQVIGNITNKIEDTKRLKNTKKLEDTARNIFIDGEPEDLASTITTLRNIDLNNIKKFSDLKNSVKKSLDDVISKQDELMKTDTRKIGVSDFNKDVESALGTNQINYMERALADIRKVIDDAGDFEDYNKVLFGKDKTLSQVIKNLETGNASLEDAYDISRYYNGQFKNKIYDTKGNAKDTLQATKYEANRVGVKNGVREMLGSDELKELDRLYGQMANTQDMVDTLTIKAYKLEQKAIKEGLPKKIGGAIGGIAETLLNVATLGGFKNLVVPAVQRIFGKGIGKTTMNALDIEKRLGKMINEIDSLLQKTTLTEADLKRLMNTTGTNTDIRKILGTNNNSSQTIKTPKTRSSGLKKLNNSSIKSKIKTNEVPSNSKTLKTSNEATGLNQTKTSKILTKSGNEQFNKDLNKLISGKLPKNHTFNIGLPSKKLKEAGISNKPIILSSAKLQGKSIQKEHPFKLANLKDLPNKIQNPIAVFESTTKPGNSIILTELKEGNKNFVGIIKLVTTKKGIEINSIRSIYPRNLSQVINAFKLGKENM